MSYPARIHADVASAWRSSTSTAIDCLPQRLPSTRPIDRRWDRSRGIIFSNASRPILRDHAGSTTTSTTAGIVQTPPAKKSYAVRSLGGQSSSHETESADAHASSGFRRLSVSEAQDLRRQLSELHSQVSQFKNERTRLEGEREAIRSRMASVATEAEARVKAAKAELEKVKREAEPERRENEKVLEQAREEVRSQLEKVAKAKQAEHEAAMAGLKSRFQELEARIDQNSKDYERRLKEARSQHAQRVAEIKNRFAPEMADLKQHSYEQGRKSAETRIETLHKEMLDHEKTTQKLRQELQKSRDMIIIEGKRGTTQEHEQEIKKKLKVIESSESRMRELEQQLQSRAEREAFNRVNYGAYSSLYQELLHRIDPVRGSWKSLKAYMSIENRHWTESAKVFQTSNLLNRFHHAGNYDHLKSRINAFLTARVANTRETADILETFQEELTTDLRPFKQASHNSRALTRALHLNDSQSKFAMTDLISSLSIAGPASERHEAIWTQIRLLKAKLSRTRSSADMRLIQRERDKLHAKEKFWRQAVIFFEIYRKVRAHEVLRYDTAVEKAIYCRLVEIHGRWKAVSHSYLDLRDRDSEKTEHLKPLQLKYWTGAKEARNILRDLDTCIRKEVMLENELGLLSPEDEDMYDREISRRIEEGKWKMEQLYSSWEQELRGLWSRNVPGNRHPIRSISKRKLIARQAGPGSDNDGRSESREDIAEPPPTAKRGIRERRARALKMKQATPMISRRVYTSAASSNTLVATRPFHSSALHSVASTTTVSQIDPMRRNCLLNFMPSLCRTMDSNNNHNSNTIAAVRTVANDAVSPEQSETDTHQKTEHSDEATIHVPDQQAVPELTYQIPDKDYRSAATSSRDTNGAYWSYRLYKGSSGDSPKVLYCTSLDVAEEKAKLFLNQSVLGFDMEWESGSTLKSGNIKRNVSVIQLAMEDKIGLFQIASFTGDSVEKLLPPTLKTILESPDVVKTGVNVRGDATRLEQCLGIKMQGMFELSHLYRVVKFSANEPQKINFRPVSLADQVLDVLLLPLKKDENRTSAWSRRLNSQQTDYAASDAYAGFWLYHALEAQRRQMKPAPPRPAFYELNQPLVLGDGTKVARYERRSVARATKKVVDDAEKETEEEEAEEYFDAPEELETDEVGVFDEVAVDDNANALRGLQIDGDISKNEDDAGHTTPQNYTWQQSSGIIFGSPAVKDHESQDGIQPSAAASPAQRKSKSTQPNTPQLILANSWLETYAATIRDPTRSARPNELRAYHLWHEQGFEPSEVAALLKDPPLSINTVASYIMNVLKINGLPSQSEKVKEVLHILPSSVHYRYEKVIRKVGLQGSW